jgi:hypothetical protein
MKDADLMAGRIEYPLKSDHRPRSSMFALIASEDSGDVPLTVIAIGFTMASSDAAGKI